MDYNQASSFFCTLLPPEVQVKEEAYRNKTSLEVSFEGKTRKAILSKESWWFNSRTQYLDAWTQSEVTELARLVLDKFGLSPVHPSPPTSSTEATGGQGGETGKIAMLTDWQGQDGITRRALFEVAGRPAPGELVWTPEGTFRVDSFGKTFENIAYKEFCYVYVTPAPDAPTRPVFQALETTKGVRRASQEERALGAPEWVKLVYREHLVHRDYNAHFGTTGESWQEQSTFLGALVPATNDEMELAHEEEQRQKREAQKAQEHQAFYTLVRKLECAPLGGDIRFESDELTLVWSHNDTRRALRLYQDAEGQLYRTTFNGGRGDDWSRNHLGDYLLARLDSNDVKTVLAELATLEQEVQA